MSSTNKTEYLRKRAEELFNRLNDKPSGKSPSTDLKTLFHELQVHQIELELQNEELMRIQSLLEYEKEQFRDLFDYAPAGYVILTKKGIIQQANQSFCKMLDIPKSEVIGKNINAFVSIESQDTLYFHLGKVLEMDLPDSCEVELKSKNQIEIWAKLESKSYYSPEKSEYLIRSSLTDISRSIELTKELSSEKKFVDKILENVERFIITIDRLGNIVQFNKASEELTGLSSDRVIGLKYWELPFMEKKYQDEAFRFFYDIDTIDFPVVFENEWLNYNNELRRIKWDFSGSVENDTLEYTIGIGEDVTEFNKKEEHIIRLSSAVEQSANSIVITDLNGNIEYANPRFYEVTGYTPEEVIGNNPRIIKYENSTINYQEMWATISGGKIWTGEFLNKTKDGHTYWELATISPVRNPKGEIINYLAIKEDITYRKQTEEQLQKARDFYLNLLEEFPVMVWQCDPGGNFNFFNQTWLNFTGGSIEEEFATGCFKNIHPDEKFIFTDAFTESLKNKSPFVFEYRLKDRYGNYRWMLSHGKPFNDIDGKYGGYIGTSIDIHDRNLAEQKLMESEDNFRRMFEDSSLGIFRLDRKFNFVSANRSFARILGFESPVEVLIDLNNNPEKYFPDYQSEKTFRKNFIKSEETHFVIEREFLRRDKTLIYVVIHFRKVFRRSTDREFYIEGFVEDITQRKQAEINLKISEQKFRELFEKSYDAILIIDKSSIIDCNPKAAIIFDYSCKELTKLIIADLSPEKQPDGRDSKTLAAEKIRQALDGIPQNFEWVHLRKNEEFDAEVSLSKILINDKPMVQAILRDISEKKRVEKQLKKAKEEAEKARAAQSEFLSLMSHEIRTPLNAVVALTDLMLHEKISQYQKENLDTVKISARHLLGLIDDILDYNKIESGNIQFENTEFGIRDMMNDLKKTLQLKADEKRLKLEVKIHDNLPEALKTDTLRLKQVLFNLLSNAIKFTEHGTVSLHVKLKSETKDLKNILFEVRDTGIGIANDRLDAIFEKFTQAEVSTSRKYGGSGLGLTVCKRLIEMQGGEIKAESEVGKGSVFTFFLPMEVANVSDLKPVEPQAAGLSENLKGMKILLVEDDQMNQFVAKRLIQTKWEADLTIVSDGAEALESLEEKDFDLVLMDLLLPGMDGCEATRIIRNNPDKKIRNPQIPVIALTADAFLESRNRAYEAGVDDFVTKPFDYHNLLGKISQYKKT